MSRKRETVESVQSDVLAAIAHVSAVARAERDEPRVHAADWLDGLFTEIRGEHHLREAAAEALTLYGGVASFSDAGTAESSYAVTQLGAALRHARTWSTRDQAPIAFRVTAYAYTTRWLRREVRGFRYDALWSDGRVDRDVLRSTYGGHSTDYHTTSRALESTCPVAGTGPWIEHGSGKPIDGPA
ncbi:hypothetical protein [Arthrobacter sp. L77]|uniref:hypothetical protein n=1 Tax=Arthrobacter sp. L77 TaxID=1496689 RepID=UPI0005B8EEFA|nr:hypothetical protein [Arthrobacter sp. L77]